MRSWLVLLALAAVDYSIYRGIVWLYDATKVSSELDHSLLVAVAFFLGGLIVLIATPVCAWRMVTGKNESAHRIPRARVVQ